MENLHERLNSVNSLVNSNFNSQLCMGKMRLCSPKVMQRILHLKFRTTVKLFLIQMMAHNLI